MTATFTSPEKAAAESAYRETLERLGKVLSGRIESARLSARLTDSPACLVAGEYGISLRMSRILKQAGQTNPFTTLPVLEINPDHALIGRLRDAPDDAAFADLASILYDQALLAEGGELEDPASFVRRINALIVAGVPEKPRIVIS